jgi:arylsulfatase A-like enzyme
MDAAAGMILDQLEQSGLMDNTLIIFTTDHGDALACHGGHFDKASYMSEEVLRIPLAMQWNGHIQPGQKTHAPVSSVSVPVTLLDAAGLEFPHKTHAKSLLIPARKQETQWPDYVVTESHGHGFGEEIASRVIVKDQYKYVSYFDEDNIDELYDLKQDPYEMNNLADIAQYSDIKNSLRRLLLKWQKETEDPMEYKWAKQIGAM